MNRAFGAEIELTGVSREHALRVLRLLRFDIRDEVRNHTTRTWWKIVSDGSVDDGFELVSPILRGHEGVEALKTAVMALDDAGGRVDRRCGLHVHIDGRGLQLREFRSIISRYAQYEEQIDAFMPPSRRGNNNSFCKSLRPIVNAQCKVTHHVHSKVTHLWGLCSRAHGGVLARGGGRRSVASPPLLGIPIRVLPFAKGGLAIDGFRFLFQ